MTEPSQQPNPSERGTHWVDGVAAVLAAGCKLAEKCGRKDLVRRLDADRKHLADRKKRLIRIVVVGEFKKGKSSLVNALVNVPICPVVDTSSTAVPMSIHHAEKPTVTLAHVPTGNGQQESSRVTVPLREVPRQVTEAPPNAKGGKLLWVDVGIPNQLLSQGVTFVDTPVGGLSENTDAPTYGVLSAADALVFTTDAAQELTATEIELIKSAKNLCPSVVCAVTKIDLYPQWRGIVEQDKAHLRAAGLDVPVFPVATALQAQAALKRDKQLFAESGCVPLLAYLGQKVVANVEVLTLTAVTANFRDVLDQVDQVLKTRQQALASPEHGKELVAELQEAGRKAQSLRAAGSRWQQTLGDGFGNISSDVDFDMRRRFRDLTREASKAINEGDPAKTWDDIQSWMRRRLTAEVVENYKLLQQRVTELGKSVAEQFAEAQQGTEVEVRAEAPTELIKQLEEATEDVEIVKASLKTKGVRTGMLLFKTVGRVALMSGMNPVSMAFGVLSGVGGLRAGAKHDVQERRQKAKAAVNQYVEDLKFHIAKDSKDTIRRMQREMRQGYSARAAELQNAAAQSVAAAKKSLQADKAQRERRLPEIEQARKSVAALRKKSEALFRASGGGVRDEQLVAHPAG
ncbi:dynamin family protein [Saccharopolyspora sp. NPDC000359]|uniref:dynamin family protein n=1 Tax=Saccharopolyspora sp. NPDC000359 TaxID=3154251 RepID=UPI00332B2C6B